MHFNSHIKRPAGSLRTILRAAAPYTRVPVAFAPGDRSDSASVMPPPPGEPTRLRQCVWRRTLLLFRRRFIGPAKLRGAELLCRHASARRSYILCSSAFHLPTTCSDDYTTLLVAAMFSPSSLDRIHSPPKCVTIATAVTVARVEFGASEAKAAREYTFAADVSSYWHLTFVRSP